MMLVLALALAAQQPRDPHEVQPERPTVATHAYAVAPGYAEIEFGLERDSRAGLTTTLVPIVFKLGLAHRVQLNAAISTLGGGGIASGFGDASVGIKWQLLHDAPLLADFAILPSFKLPTGGESSGRGTGTTDVSLLLVSSRHLGPIALDLNLGVTRRSGDGMMAPRTASVWTVSTGGPFAGRFGWVVEVYGYPGTSGIAGQPPIVALLAGPTIAVKPWWAFDAGIIEPLQGPQSRAIYTGMVINAGRLWRVR